jgi:hypothetical protein
MVNIEVALDKALNGTLVFDMNHLRVFRLTEMPTKFQGQSMTLNIKGKMGKFRLGEDVRLSVLEGCFKELPTGQAAVILPYDPASPGWSFFKGTINTDLLLLKRENLMLKGRLNDLYSNAQNAQSVDEIMEMIRITIENSQAISKRTPDVSDYMPRYGSHALSPTAQSVLGRV